jgi:uncharacterized protein (TIGR02246 family)
MSINKLLANQRPPFSHFAMNQPIARFLRQTLLATLLLSPISFVGCARHHHHTHHGAGHEGKDANVGQEEAIRSLHKEYDAAWRSGSADALGKLLTEDWTQIDPEGNVTSKGQILSDISAGQLKFETGYSENVRVTFHGPTALVLADWNEKGVYNGKPFENKSKNLVVYVQQASQWRVASDQSTRIKAD